MKTLLFIDTNILLDFYRFRGKDVSAAFLGHIDRNLDRIITTHQVEMEFKSRRQGVILDALKTMADPKLGELQPPGFLRDAKPARALENSKKSVTRHTKMLRDRVVRIIGTPTRNDPVYKCAQRLFRARSGCHLFADHADARKVERLALRRFFQGQPPRKPGDTSYGDAINWEWMLQCCSDLDAELTIVSRDHDYGVSHEKEVFLNDFLRSEFQRRVSKKRRITLTNLLTEGFKSASIAVTRAEEQEEDRVLAERAHAVVPSSERGGGLHDFVVPVAGRTPSVNREEFASLLGFLKETLRAGIDPETKASE